jgi:short-subunit dehydrogenase
MHAEHSEPTVVINNAGVGHGKSILDETEEQIRLTMNVNLMVYFLMTKEFVPSIVKNNHGHVVRILDALSFSSRILFQGI